MTKTATTTAAQMAAKTADAYSAPYFAEGEWEACAYLLMRDGYTDEQTETILRSKWTRWARDMANTYDEATVDDFAAYMATVTPAQVARLMREAKS